MSAGGRSPLPTGSSSSSVNRSRKLRVWIGAPFRRLILSPSSEGEVDAVRWTSHDLVALARRPTGSLAGSLGARYKPTGRARERRHHRAGRFEIKEGSTTRDTRTVRNRSISRQPVAGRKPRSLRAGSRA